MKSGMPRSRVEMIFVIAMVVLCGGLTILQYRWTGELAQAEMERMSGSLANQTKLLARAFDAELSQACEMLVPTGAELQRGTPEAVHLGKLLEWKATQPRPLFKRIAAAIPSAGKLELFEVGISSGKFSPMAWPPEWADLKQNLTEKSDGGSPPFADPAGMLWEFPVREARPPGWRGGPDGPGGMRRPPGPPGGGEEREWCIVELDADYLKYTWLPELVASHLNPEGNAIFDVTVRSKSADKIIFSTSPEAISRNGKTQVLEFNSQGFGTGYSPDRPIDSQWVLEAGLREGSLEATVAGSRRRNLAVAVLLNCLIVTAGWMLLRVTRTSRLLAEEQMKFVANVTHELRTPLTVIRGAAHNLKRGIVRDQEGVARYSGLILEHAESLGEMVEQVLDFSAAQGSQFPKEREPVDIGALLEAAISNLKADVRFSGCEIALDLPSDLPTVRGDPAALRRALVNLLENAAKHGGAGGWIGVSARMSGKALEIKIADHGPGIPADEQRMIFKPFFRGGVARTHQIRGNGLGLSLVKEIAAAHGGTISVESESGKGSVFTLSLPLEVL